ncbi:DUF1559 domain-containing protein [Rosistilla oblonga]|uniref:DUF1559 family PulG-like putative transporter n=1 Tax=Rosistilla oblonga TaxID=2527990 RepID=UPI003A9790AF
MDARRQGLTVLELLVVIAVISIMAALLLPALMSARESARRVACRSHLRELGIAAHHFHDGFGHLPRAWKATDDGKPFAFAWAANMLPQLGQQNMLAQLDLATAPTGLTTSEAAEAFAYELFVCPSDLTELSFELQFDTGRDDDVDGSTDNALHAAASPNLGWFPTANYVGVYGTHEADDYEEAAPTSGFADGSIINEQDIRFRDLRRGLSNTMIVGERTMAAVPSTWLGIDLRGGDAPCRLVGSAMTQPNCETCDECEFSSRHPGGSNFLWGDGRVTLVSESIDSVLYQENSRRMP